MYQGFSHHHNDLSAFAITLGTFVISLKNGNIVHHTPEDLDSFLLWLRNGNVREVGKPAAAEVAR